jgi:hypothetical protein
MHYRQPLSLTLFQREKGSATRLCVPVHPVYWLIWRQICRQLEIQGALSGMEYQDSPRNRLPRIKVRP